VPKLEPITIYWAPNFPLDEGYFDWDILYNNPDTLSTSLKEFINKDTANVGLLRCPAFKDLIKNVFYFSATLPIDCKIQKKEIVSTEKNFINVSLGREPSFLNRTHINASMSWVFFSEEPLTIEVVPPFILESPHLAYGTFVPGTYNIGSWFRPVNAEFILNTGIEHFKLNSGEPIFFLRAKTERPVVFKRFSITQEIRNISITCAQGAALFGLNIPLIDRYKLFKNTSMDKKTMNLIKKAVIN
jgi:hypothetical protein